MNLIAPEALANLHPDLPKFLIDYAADKAMDLMGGVISESIRRVLGKPNDVQTIKIELARITTTLEALKESQEQQNKRVNRLEAQRTDPAFQHFTDEAIESAAESLSEGKRVVLGRLIGERFQTETETPETSSCAKRFA